MIPPAPRTDPLELLYYGLLVGNVLVALVCGIVGPRVWARWLGATFLWGNGLLLLWVTVCLTHFALSALRTSAAGQVGDEIGRRRRPVAGQGSGRDRVIVPG